MFVLNHALVSEELEIENLLPVFRPVKNYGDFLHALRLSQCQGGEEFVERSEASWKANQRFRSQQKVHFADLLAFSLQPCGNPTGTVRVPRVSIYIFAAW